MEGQHHYQLLNLFLKEYLLERLMISLAVTLGFIAENIRENLTYKGKQCLPVKEQLLDYY